MIALALLLLIPSQTGGPLPTMAPSVTDADLERFRAGDPFLLVEEGPTRRLRPFSNGNEVGDEAIAPLAYPEGRLLTQGHLADVQFAVHQTADRDWIVALAVRHDGRRWRLVGLSVVEDSDVDSRMDPLAIDAGRVDLSGDHLELGVRYTLRGIGEDAKAELVGTFTLDRGVIQTFRDRGSDPGNDVVAARQQLRELCGAMRYLQLERGLVFPLPLWAPEVLAGEPGLLVAFWGWSHWTHRTQPLLEAWPMLATPAPYVRSIELPAVPTRPWYEPFDPRLAPESLLRPEGRWAIRGETQHRRLGDRAFLVELPHYTDGWSKRLLLIVERSEGDAFVPRLLCLREATDVGSTVVGGCASCDFLSVERVDEGVRIRARVLHAPHAETAAIEFAFVGTFNPDAPDTLPAPEDPEPGAGPRRPYARHDDEPDGPWTPLLLGLEETWAALLDARNRRGR